MSTRDASKDKNTENTGQLARTAALFGGIQYEIGSQQLAMLEPTTEEFASRAILPRDGDRSIASFRYLPGTEKEVDKIYTTLSANHWKAQLYTENQATELAFKKLDGAHAPDILHIATHGFYFPLPLKGQENHIMLKMDNTDNYCLTDNPLRRTGLAMAGANLAWQGEELPPDIEDGILTAYEISNITQNPNGSIIGLPDRAWRY